MLSHYDAPIKLFLESLGAYVSPLDHKTYFDYMVFPSGEEISPFLYGQVKLKRTTINVVRDLEENAVYRKIPHDIPKIGIGRGANLLNVLNGGSMYQYVNGHIADHIAVDLMSGTEVRINSCHRQQMITPTNAEMIMAASVSEQKETPKKLYYIDPHKNTAANYYPDEEVAWINSSKSFLFQPRVSFNSDRKTDKNTNEIFIDYFERYVHPHTKRTFCLKDAI